MNDADGNVGQVGSSSFFQTLKILLADLGSALHTRLDLFVTELEEERERLKQALILAVLVIFGLAFGFALINIFLVALFWEHARLFESTHTRSFADLPNDWHCQITSVFGVHDEVAIVAKQILEQFDRGQLQFHASTTRPAAPLHSALSRPGSRQRVKSDSEALGAKDHFGARRRC